MELCCGVTCLGWLLQSTREQQWVAYGILAYETVFFTMRSVQRVSIVLHILRG